MNILFAGGGTGGHIYPSLAVADNLRHSGKGHKILFVGRKGGFENSIIRKAGFEVKEIEVYGIPKRIDIQGIKKIFKTLRSPKSAKEIIREFSPDVIFATGGYVSYPCLKAGINAKIPTVIHESNTYPGKVTRLLGGRCTRVLLNLDATRKKLSSKKNVKTVGLPLRKEFTNCTREEARKKLRLENDDFYLVSFGGSGGSEKMNASIIALMKSFSEKKAKVRHVHATGKRYFESTRKFEAELTRGKNGCKLVPYIEDMPIQLFAADLVICRCGAVTLGELAAVGAASILIPSPNVSDDHQRKNALFLSENKAAVMIEEKELNERTLLDAVSTLESDKEKRIALAKNMFSLAKPEALGVIVQELLELSKNKK